MKTGITILPAVAAIIPYSQLQVTKRNPEAFAPALKRLE
jgi:hypothetical protein